MQTLKCLAIACSLVLRAQAQPEVTELASPNPVNQGMFGFALRGLPDLNGDRIGEFYIHSEGEKRIHVYDGAGPAYLYSIQLSGGCGIGYELAPSGDLTGDGVTELMVPRPCNNAVQILNGATRAELYRLTSPNPTSESAFGNVLRLVPDLTGDGKEDWAIHQNEWGSSGVGRVYLFDSQTRRNVRTVWNSEADYRFRITQMEVVSDLDGDGKPDLLVSGENRALVRSSGTGKVLFEIEDPEPDSGPGFGMALANPGDVNKDGVADLAVGAFWKDANAGALYLFSGADGSWLRTVRSPLAASGRQFARSINVLPDLNGDKVPELWLSESSVSAGATHVLDGATSQVLKTINCPGEIGSFFLLGTVREEAPPGIRAYLFGAGFAKGSGRAYYLPYSEVVKRTRLASASRGGVPFRLEVTGEAGRKLEIQSSEDLAVWQSLTNIILPETKLEIIDGSARSRRYYRALEK